MRLIPVVFAAWAVLLTAGQPVFATDFTPQRFFSGRTEGSGKLKILFARTRVVKVHGRGQVMTDGTLVLDQRVEIEGDAPADRTWRIRPVGDGRYEGTLSDASGPVHGDVRGRRLHLVFPMKGGFVAEQWLDLLPSGNVALNHMVVRKWGLPVATLEETINKTR